MRSWILGGVIMLQVLAGGPATAEESPALTGEAAWSVYETLRQKAAGVPGFRCDAIVSFCRIGPNQDVPSVAYPACSHPGPFPLWQKGDRARWQTDSPARFNHPAVVYVADPATGSIFIQWHSSADSAPDVSRRVQEYMMPQAELGAGWKLERSKPLEVFEARALNGKPLMVFRQPAEAGTDPFWGGGWALWIDPDTGMAMRADGVTLSMLPDVRSVHVAECRNVVLEDVPDKVFAVPTEHVIWPPREGVKNP